MPRLVIHTAKRPYRYTTKSGEDVWICMCGFSETYPICSGRHRQFANEDEKSYSIYDQNGNLLSVISREDEERLRLKDVRKV